MGHLDKHAIPRVGLKLSVVAKTTLHQGLVDYFHLSQRRGRLWLTGMDININTGAHAVKLRRQVTLLDTIRGYRSWMIAVADGRFGNTSDVFWVTCLA